MPYRRRPIRRRRPVRRYRRRRRWRGRKTVSRVRHVSGFPDAMYTTLKYASDISPGSVGVAINPYLLRGNSCFDPDLTGIGHQPMLFDQYSAVYDRYIVYSSSLSLTVTNENGNEECRVCIFPMSTASQPYTSMAAAKEQPYSKFVTLNTAGSDGNTANLFLKTSTRKIRGERMVDDEFGAQVSANPQRQWYWHIVYQSVNSSTNTVLRFMVSLTYKVKFHKRVAVDLS